MLMIALLLAATPVGPAQADAEAQAGTDYAAADAAMTVQYRAAMARMRTRDVPAPPGVPARPSFANALLQAQRAWLPFRDSECLAEAFAYRGPAPAVVDTQCKTRLTVERTRQLRALAQ
ncbi:lysozyme inhibitor LprI family protein [Sphingomonas bacterium]|uniref:lysozyme inhibitor LprI family protein n=1 Tax=Sphingomonas bacterium TaxID=1895847 RepID=UPI001575B905|nr:lysozyme inhibitor LprI family protein [Sphingomonas bacterium]